MAECRGKHVLYVMLFCHFCHLGGAQGCLWKWLFDLGVGAGPQVPDSHSYQHHKRLLIVRSSLLPVFYALPFLLLKFLHLDFQWLVIFLPRWYFKGLGRTDLPNVD